MNKFWRNQRGSFTVEATFICTISIAIVMAMLYVLLFYTDRIYVESKVRRSITKECQDIKYQGVMGAGELKKTSELDIFSSKYELHYEIPKRFPLTLEYLDKEFFSFDILIKDCDKNTSELVRFYEAVKTRK